MTGDVRSVLVGLLDEHTPAGTISSTGGWVECTCGARLSVPSGFNLLGYPNDCEEQDAAHHAHLADVIASAGVVVATSEVEALADGEDARVVLYGVTGTHPGDYSGVTKDEALESAGEVLTRLRALVAGARGGAQ